MKDRKIQKLFTDFGFGFPVKVTSAPLRKIRGQWVLDIDFNKYEKAVLLLLAIKEARLTGDEVKFIRQSLGLNLKSFGKRFGDVAHSAVIKWEKTADGPTSMNWACEKDIRLAIISELKPKKLYDIYLNLSESMPAKRKVLKVDSKDLLAA